MAMSRKDTDKWKENMISEVRALMIKIRGRLFPEYQFLNLE